MLSTMVESTVEYGLGHDADDDEEPVVLVVVVVVVLFVVVQVVQFVGLGGHVVRLVGQ